MDSVIDVGTGAPNRLTAFDNLRTLLVVAVVFQHAANAYLGLNWWPVNQARISPTIAGLGAVLDAFTMQLLFFLAGFFALPSLEKGGVGRFIKGKLRRLGLPWLVATLTIGPILPLVYHYTRNGLTLTQSYWSLWKELFGHALEFKIGLFPSLNQLMATNQFYQRYMWFLSLLLLFFLILAVIYAFRKNWFAVSDSPVKYQPRSARSTLWFMLGLAGITSVASFGAVGLTFALSPGLTNPEPLFSLGSVIQFRPSRLPLYVIYFGLGVLAYRNRWLARGRFPGDFRVWQIAFAATLIPLLVTYYRLLLGPGEDRELMGAMFFLIMNFLTAAALGLFTSLALGRWNRPTPLGANLAANSYNLYLTHYPFVILFQLILYGVSGLPELVKFALVVAASLACAYPVSQFLVRPRPGLAAAGAFGLLAVMWLTITP